jgi:hypothetical protein
MEDIWKEQVFPILARLGLNLKRNGAGTITARIKKKRVVYGLIIVRIIG